MSDYFFAYHFFGDILIFFPSLSRASAATSALRQPSFHMGLPNICVQQLQALITRGQCTLEDLIDVWIWLFNYHHPDQGRIWVLHLAWAHTLSAPPTEPQPAPKPGGRTRAAPQLSTDAL